MTLNPLDVTLIDQRIADLKDDLAFWENVKVVLCDPRIAEFTALVECVEDEENALPMVRGELQGCVYQVLPEFGSGGISVSAIRVRVQESGYVFSAKSPGVAINGALSSLAEKQMAASAGKSGVSRLWTRAKPADSTSKPTH